MEIESSGTGIENTKTFTVAETATINITNISSNDITRGIYNNKATFTVEGKLTIYNSSSATRSDTGGTPTTSAIYNTNDSFLTIKGELIIDSISTGNAIVTYGIYSGVGVIEGKATINVTTSGSGQAFGYVTYATSSCINCNAFTITKDAIVNLTLNGANPYVYGIYCDTNDTFITDGTVTLNVSFVNAGTYSGARVNGIYLSRSDNFIIETDAILDMTINGRDSTYGIYNSNSPITINGAVNITSNGSGINLVGSSATITGTGTITVNGDPYDF